MAQTELQVEDRADALLGKLGFTAWRPGQREAVEAALEGRDSLIVMPTGGGKSLCYQLPGLATEDLTIVVSPLIALMNDQWRRLSGAGHPVAMVTSAMSEEAVRHALAQVRGGAARIVYCSPERFASASSSRRSASAGSTCWRSTRRTASPSGGTTSGPTTCACRRSPSGSGGRR